MTKETTNTLTRTLAGKAPVVLKQWDKKLCFKYRHPNAQQAAFLEEYGLQRNEKIGQRRLREGRGSCIYGLKPQRKFMRGEDGELRWHRMVDGQWVGEG